MNFVTQTEAEFGHIRSWSQLVSTDWKALYLVSNRRSWCEQTTHQLAWTRHQYTEQQVGREQYILTVNTGEVIF